MEEQRLYWITAWMPEERTMSLVGTLDEAIALAKLFGDRFGASKLEISMVDGVVVAILEKDWVVAG